jgi:hypothetical protein
MIGQWQWNVRLAATLAADVVGYSRLMEQDEAGTLAALAERRKEILEIRDSARIVIYRRVVLALIRRHLYFGL